MQPNRREAIFNILYSVFVVVVFCIIKEVKIDQRINLLTTTCHADESYTIEVLS